jgi:hypothetical protein
MHLVARNCAICTEVAQNMHEVTKENCTSVTAVDLQERDKSSSCRTAKCHHHYTALAYTYKHIQEALFAH